MIATDSHSVLDELELMRGEQDRHAACRLLTQHTGQQVADDRIEAGERLVEHEELGLMHERRRELHPLLVALRQLLDPRAGAVAETEPLEPTGRRRARRACVSPWSTPKYSS